MRYAELPLPSGLEALVPAAWTLAPGDDAPAWIEHEATPDGCVEIIRRTGGRSTWIRAQPEYFVTGLSAAPIRFGFSGDAAFTAIKLWPWAWEVLSGPLCPAFADDWMALPADHPAARLLAGNAADLPLRVQAFFAGRAAPPIASAILNARSVMAVATQANMTPRALQRWFARHIGLTPRTYLRLLRFRTSLLTLPDQASLAGHAAEQGYADQAHMARDFRALAGTAPRDARKRAKGPFL